jgi:hypothetical protein
VAGVAGHGLDDHLADLGSELTELLAIEQAQV